MPELPEVETVVRRLAPFVQGESVEKFEIFDPKMLIPEAGLVQGGAIGQVSRLAKQITMAIDSAHGQRLGWLSFHLGMTGSLLWQPHQSPQPQLRHHLRAQLHLGRGDLLFCDIRRFGKIRWARHLSELDPGGCDPFSKEFTWRHLSQLLASSQQAIKVWLLRQDRLVGLGNIYASEITHHAGIDPARPANSLSTKETRRLHRTAKEVLRQAIECGGTTFSDFQDCNGCSGGFQERLAVYGRDGAPCPTCSTPVIKTVQQGRSTFFCPTCQH
jgi:formamidopyrimidine-DNA glycosylase